MLEHELLIDRGILSVEVRGALSEDDFASLASAADDYISEHGNLNGLLIHARKFPGRESLDGMIAQFRFVRDHHRKIRKVAFVSGSELLSLLPKLARHFVSAEVRAFREDEKDKALEWL